MTTRNIAIYKQVSDERIEIKAPYTEYIGFNGGTIIIFVAVDNDFENDSFSVACDNVGILIKREGNVVRLIIEPNYGNVNRDFVITFEHNIDAEDSISLLVRQQYQPYNIVIEPIKVVKNLEGCCVEDENEEDEEEETQTLSGKDECFFYASKDGGKVEHILYRIRDNVILNPDNENEQEYIDHFTQLHIEEGASMALMYRRNGTNGDDDIYAEEYLTKTEEEQSEYSALYYIFYDDNYNVTHKCICNEEHCEDDDPIRCEGVPNDYILYRCWSVDGEVISAYEWLMLPTLSEDIAVGRLYYNIHEYIKVYTEDEVLKQQYIPRYKFYVSKYRNTITEVEYNKLLPQNTEDINDIRSKNGCVPLTYINIYHDDIEVSADEYEDMPLSNRYHYRPNRYVVLDIDDKGKCKWVVESDKYETYVVEGKYDYMPCDSTCTEGEYYREIGADTYDEYPEYGQIDYYPYQYICHTAVDDFAVNDVIDFVEYDNLDGEDYFRLYEYGDNTFVSIIREWKKERNNNITIITDRIYDALEDEDKEGYEEYYETIIREQYKVECLKWRYVGEDKMITAEEYNELSSAEKTVYEQQPITIDGETWYKHKTHVIVTQATYNNLSWEEQDNYAKNMFTPSSVITVSKYESLPVYGKNAYKPYLMSCDETMMSDDGEEITVESIELEEYFAKPLTIGDYVVDSITMMPDEISCEDYDALDAEDQEHYEPCYRLKSVVNEKVEEGELPDYLKTKVLEVDVLCTGGTYDFIINGVTKYRRSITYTYSEDDFTSEQIVYAVNNGEVYIDNSVPFKLTKVRGGKRVELNGDIYSKGKLLIYIYGWLDSTFSDGKLDNNVFYRIKLSHKDVIGLDATLRIELQKHDDIELNNLAKKQENTQPSSSSSSSDGESGYEPENMEPDEELVEFIPGVDSDVDGILEFPAQQSTKTVEVITNPIDSAISATYTGMFIESFVINNHTINITVKKNPFNIERNCMFKIINKEYPAYVTTFIVRQLAKE